MFWIIFTAFYVLPTIVCLVMLRRDARRDAKKFDHDTAVADVADLMPWILCPVVNWVFILWLLSTVTIFQTAWDTINVWYRSLIKLYIGRP